MSEVKLSFSQTANNYHQVRNEFHAFLANESPQLHESPFPPEGLGFGLHLNTIALATALSAPISVQLPKKREKFGGKDPDHAKIKDNNAQADEYLCMLGRARQWWESHMDDQLKAYLDTVDYPTKPVPSLGRCSIPLPALITLLEGRYQVLSQAALVELYRSFTIPVSNPDTFAVTMSEWSTTFQSLMDNKQPESEVKKILYLKEAISGSPALTSPYNLYMSGNTDLATRTFTKCVAFICLQLSTNSGSAPIGQSLHTMDTVVAEQVRIQVAAALAAIAATAPAPASNRGRGRPNRTQPVSSGQRTPAQPAAAPQSSKSDPYVPTPGYCWFHGHKDHKGVDCRSMTDARGFNTAHRKATSGVIINGVAGHT
jgi:hypothetical protein